MRELTPTQKGGIAELKISAAVAACGIVVLRPMTEGVRYDLAFEMGDRLVRVQCKWARRRGEVITTQLATQRLTPRGYVRSTYSADQIDFIAIYCPDTDDVYLVPIQDVDGQSYLYLRLGPTRNNQATGVKWAAEYRLGAVAQLGERRAGSAKVRGSSPLSSTHEEAAPPRGLFVL